MTLPRKWGPSTRHDLRDASEEKNQAPLRVPTSSVTPRGVFFFALEGLAGFFVGFALAILVRSPGSGTYKTLKLALCRHHRASGGAFFSQEGGRHVVFPP